MPSVELQLCYIIYDWVLIEPRYACMLHVRILLALLHMSPPQASLKRAFYRRKDQPTAKQNRLHYAMHACVACWHEAACLGTSSSRLRPGTNLVTPDGSPPPHPVVDDARCTCIRMHCVTQYYGDIRPEIAHVRPVNMPGTRCTANQKRRLLFSISPLSPHKHWERLSAGKHQRLLFSIPALLGALSKNTCRLSTKSETNPPRTN